MSHSSQPGPHAAPVHHQSFWLWVMCLTGVDYFSTLAYQPSIAFENAGLLAPFATVVLVLVTLFGALPVYRYVAGKSFTGQGSIGMLANLVSGWPGKVLVLTLLGFAATDFVITKTLSAADAAEHLINNPVWPLDHANQSVEDRQRLIVTMGLLVLLGAVFLRGFREVIGLAVVLVGTYLLLNAVVVGAGLVHLAGHPTRFAHWTDRIAAGQWYLEHNPVSGSGLASIALFSLIVFPRLALGLSGFETGVAVMPLVRGDGGDDPKRPAGRIRSTRRLLLTAAVVMSVFLLGSSLVVTTLIEPNALVSYDGAGNPLELPRKPPAADRALAYLAHGEGSEQVAPFFGPTFGTAYDLVTVVILWFAGASAMAGLLNLVPQYLPRYGMAPEWARAVRPLVILFTLINLLVTWIFDASVKAQSDAYATGVLALITSACVATVIDRWRSRADLPWVRRVPWAYGLITAAFAYTFFDVVVGKPAGIKIAACFIAAIVVTSLASRLMRARELRFAGFHFPDPKARLMWDTIRHLGLSVLVPHRPGRRSLQSKEVTIREEHRIPSDEMVVFVEVELADPSEFAPTPELTVVQEEGRYVLRVRNAASIAHTLAAVALEIRVAGKPPPILHFGWTDESPVSGTLGFLLFGEGNVPWEVRELLIKAEPDGAKRPKVMIADS
ncbi:MAG TPA: amino acid transporter [Gemmataceae bacterium]|nr:amino acid transporter [Gemmataceae bacterium]